LDHDADRDYVITTEHQASVGEDRIAKIGIKSFLIIMVGPGPIGTVDYFLVWIWT